MTQPKEDPALDAMLASERYDDALAHLEERVRRDPRDFAARSAIRDVRERHADAALVRLGSRAARPQRLRGPDTTRPLGVDERYIFDRIDGTRTIDELLRLSTLGRYETLRLLVWLLEHEMIRVELPTATVRPFAVDQVQRVLVADASPTFATLIRTLLRVTLVRGVSFESVLNASDAIETARRTQPGLVLVDFRLPGAGDGLATLRHIRNELGGAVPAVLIAQRHEADFVSSRLPEQAAVVVRPIERDPLARALRTLVPAAVAA